MRPRARVDTTLLVLWEAARAAAAATKAPAIPGRAREAAEHVPAGGRGAGAGGCRECSCDVTASPRGELF